MAVSPQVTRAEIARRPANTGRNSETLPRAVCPRERCCRFVNGGGGGNRTRVRRRFNVSLYVRSLSFVIRRRCTRQARLLRSLGSVITRVGTLMPPCRTRPDVVALSAYQAVSGKTRCIYITQRVPMVRWQLFNPGFLRGHRGPRHATHASSTPVETLSPPQYKGYGEWQTCLSALAHRANRCVWLLFTGAKIARSAPSD